VTPDNRFLSVDRMAFTNFDLEVTPDAPPPAGTCQRSGTFAPFRDPAYWQGARASAPQFRMLAAFGEPDGGNIPDPPDVPDDK
jgi:hypothetical protein